MSLFHVVNLAASGKNYTYNIWGNDNIGQVSVTSSSTNRYYYLKDHLGSIKMTVGSTGNVVGYDDFYPYGMTMSGRSYTSSADQRFKFTSKERDFGETGWDYFGKRYYDSRIGKWLSSDPLFALNNFDLIQQKMLFSFSPYVYVKDNPLIYIDPDGLTDIKITIYRQNETKTTTIGRLIVTNSSNSNKLSGFTLERSWAGNAKNLSRIMSGEYNAYRSSSENFPKAGGVIRLQDKNSRIDILIHYGNTSEDTEGCILVGSSKGKDRINASVDKLKELINYTDQIIENDKKNGEETNIKVIIIDPPKKKENKAEPAEKDNNN
jgi:RHS repeat-associated protein